MNGFDEDNDGGVRFEQETRYECPYCGKTYNDPQRCCCGECHLEEVKNEQVGTD